MRLTLLTVGKLKSGPEQQLFDRYFDRLEKSARQIGITSVTVREFSESRAATTGQRKQQEAEKLLAACPQNSALIALDETGQTIPSRKFASQVKKFLDDGTDSIVFIIGGPDGLAPDLLSACKQKIAFGAMTWPHQLARILLAEQLYRATTILTGHPYHRG